MSANSKPSLYPVSDPLAHRSSTLARVLRFCVCAIGLVGCGSKPHVNPAKKICGQGQLHFTAEDGEALGRDRAAITSPQHDVFTPMRRSNREVVQIILRLNGVEQGIATGVIVGRHTILTVAHTFLDNQYDEIAVRARDTQGNWREGRPLQEFINSDYRNFHNGHTQQGNDVPADSRDVALLAMPNDFGAGAINLVNMRGNFNGAQVIRNFVPCTDADNCTDEQFQLLGYGYGGNWVPPATVPLRGINAVPLNSPADIAATRFMTFGRADANDDMNSVVEPGDSGGPVYRFNPSNSRWEVVALIGGSEDADDNFSLGGSYGLHDVAYAITLTDAVLRNVTDQAENWRRQNQRGGIAYPAAQTTLPNGTATVIHQPVNATVGPDVPVQGNPYTGVNGYFVENFPLEAQPSSAPFPPPQCR